MTDEQNTPMHVPTPQFRASLENEIIHALRREARELSGDERTRALQKSRADYQGCIDTFEPIVGFGLAARNIEVCKAQRAAVDADLARAMMTGHEMDHGLHPGSF